MASSKTTRVKLHRYYKVTKASPTPLRTEDIQVDVRQSDANRPERSTEPNFLGLAVLWAHYEAHKQGLLLEDGPAPWDIANIMEDENHPWLLFLREIITDLDWVRWIQDPVEVKQRVLSVLEPVREEEIDPIMQDHVNDDIPDTSD